MKRLSREQFEQLSAGAALSSDEHGIKVLLTPDGRVIKLFRRKRLFSSAWLRPYAARFARASREFARRGIVGAVVEDLARVPSIERDLVIYRNMQGTTLRDVLASGVDHVHLINAIAKLLATLHERGVYFRAVHFGNVLVEGHGRTCNLSLIDLAEARFRRRPLSPTLRARNFRPLTRYAEDFAVLQAFGIARFVRHYVYAAALPRWQEARFIRALRRVNPAFEACGKGVIPI